ncbi:hypothetical protein BQ8482_490063 [Mesorhizobium delmotii]|uniref:Uncharacterized protein n=1 Tax=Mesorhizobium delmotii TaxID=1631247 RepID=A0A2P9AU73_9HYPH|nr:hypothetical protein BQ8482_490063 [Mesorhizobium delmotii]
MLGVWVEGAHACGGPRYLNGLPIKKSPRCRFAREGELVRIRPKLRFLRHREDCYSSLFKAL